MAGILGVPFVEQVLHRHKVAESFSRVDVVHDGDIPNPHTVKFFFQKLTDHQSVSSEPRMIFDDQVSDFALFAQLHDFGESRSCKAHTRPSVVDENTGIAESVLTGVLFQY